MGKDPMASHVEHSVTRGMANAVEIGIGYDSVDCSIRIRLLHI